MENNIVKSVAKALKSKYADVNIYIESVKQGFEEPCFFIKNITGSFKKISIGRDKATTKLDVRYFDNKYSDLNSMAFNLYEILEQVETVGGGSMLGKYMDYEIVDGVLHFFVAFDDVLMNVPQEVDNMEQIDIEVK